MVVHRILLSIICCGIAYIRECSFEKCWGGGGGKRGGGGGGGGHANSVLELGGGGQVNSAMDLGGGHVNSAYVEKSL